MKRPSFLSQLYFLHSRNDQPAYCSCRECPLGNTIGGGRSAQNTTARGYACISKCGSAGAGLQSRTVGAEDLILTVHAGEGIFVRISSVLIPRTNCPLIFGVYLPVQFYVKIKSQFTHSENSQRESKSAVRGNIQKCTAGLNSLTQMHPEILNSRSTLTISSPLTCLSLPRISITRSG